MHLLKYNQLWNRDLSYGPSFTKINSFSPEATIIITNESGDEATINDENESYALIIILVILVIVVVLAVVLYYFKRKKRFNNFSTTDSYSFESRNEIGGNLLTKVKDISSYTSENPLCSTSIDSTESFYMDFSQDGFSEASELMI